MRLIETLFAAHQGRYFPKNQENVAREGCLSERADLCTEPKRNGKLSLRTKQKHVTFLIFLFCFYSFLCVERRRRCNLKLACLGGKGNSSRSADSGRRDNDGNRESYLRHTRPGAQVSARLVQSEQIKIERWRLVVIDKDVETLVLICKKKKKYYNSLPHDEVFLFALVNVILLMSPRI